MVDAATLPLNESLSVPGLIGILSNLPGFDTLVRVGVTIGILLIVYIVFLIIRSITQILYSIRFGRMTKNVEEINKKMDILISRISGKESKATKSKKL